MKQSSFDQEPGIAMLEKSQTLSSNEDVTDRAARGEDKLTWQLFFCMVGMCLAFVVAEVTPLFLATCFTIIAADLHALEHVIWILVGPYIATGAVAPFVGNLSDLLGRRVIILGSLVLTLVAFSMMAAAPTFAVFLTGAIFCGAAIGTLIMSVISAASELVPMHKRGATIGYISLGIIPFAPGSMYGQLIAMHNWRYIFLMLGLIAVLAFIFLFIFYSPPPRPNSAGLSKMDILKRIDYGGCFLSVSGIVVFLLGINWGGEYRWASTRVVSCLVVGPVLMGLFVLYEIYGTKYPMFPMRLIQSKRHFAAVAVLCLTSGVNYVPITVFWTIQVYTVYGATFSDAGRWLLPLGFCIIGGAGISAILITVFKKHIHWVLMFFCILQTVGIASMAAFDPHNINSVWAPMVVGLIGVGGVLLPSQVVFSVISPDDLIGTSVALSVVIRMIGQVIGKSMFYNIFKTDVIKHAPKIIAIPAVQAGFTSVPRITAVVNQMTAGPLKYYIDRGLFPEITHDPAKIQALIEAGKTLYGNSLGMIYLISLPWGILAIGSCFLLWGVDKYIDEHVAVHL
ncbi:unnamed protein product [Zymoseptoria tritici ST99CH_1A5]|uniref:Major facilitator superfamily (MFS) profile domain-containing protein n=1 Tax=Zymoseptoria tritici ST99CH_1A5 TaxID=1276529 RepID=A0A1Y6LVA9_ZYMTR|nr:unnamed protein product [Zymoseptoria tritici ST99CH_1A5]